jgi:t-SNARE complex subunit (syntaxin)
MQQQIPKFEVLEDTYLIAERHREIRIIEEDMGDLIEISLQLNSIVDEQDKGIKQVATYIEESRDHVESGVEEIKIAADRKQKNRTFWAKVGGVVAAVLVVMLVVALV